MTSPAPDSSSLHDLLLPYLYGTLNDDETARLEAALNDSADLRAALERAREGVAVMAEAAKDARGREIKLAGPADTHAANVRSIGSAKAAGMSRRRWPVAVAAAAVLLMTLVGYAWFVAERQAIRASQLVVEVESPSLFYRGAPAEMTVRTTDGAGRPVAADLRVTATTITGTPLGVVDVRSSADGTARVVLPLANVPSEGESNGVAILHVVAVSGDQATADVGRVSIAENLLDLTLQAPQTFSPDRPAMLAVHTAGFNGAAISTDVTVRVADPLSGTTTDHVVKTDAAGHGQLALDTATFGQEVRIMALCGEGLRLRQTPILKMVPGEPLLAYVSTSKPMFRPGEIVRMRAVVLTRTDLTPAGSRLVKLLVTDPSGATAFETDLPVRLQNGAAWAEWQVPQGLTGGDYRVIVRDIPATNETEPAFADAARVIQIRNFRNPAFITHMELDRDAYGPGDAGNADLSVRTRDGRIPYNALLDCRVNVDGNTVRQWQVTLPTSGNVRLPFALPAEIARGDASLVVTINDGAQVDSAVETIRVTLDRIDMQFFPEGGDLVAGFENRVYFRARNVAGEAIDVEGNVIDETGATVGSLKVDTLGMGRFSFTPVAGSRYMVKVTKPAGISMFPVLPPVMPAGVVLKATDEVIGAKQPIRLQVQSNFNGPHAVAVYLRGMLVAQTTLNIQSSAPQSVTLDPHTTQGGVYRVTVFSPEQSADGSPRPAAERLIARDPGERLTISATAGKHSYSPGEEVVLTLATTDATNGEPVQTVLGVSVLDESVVSLAKDEDTAPMPFHFLVGLDVQELEKVKVYLDGTAKAATALDRLLGTQGWRRFAWVDRDGFIARYGKDDATRIVPVAPVAGSVNGGGSDTLQTAQARLDGLPTDGTYALSTADRVKRHMGGLLAVQAGRFAQVARWLCIGVAGLIALWSLAVFVQRMPMASVPVRGPAVAFAASLAVVVSMGVMISESSKSTGAGGGMVALSSPGVPEPMNPPNASILQLSAESKRNVFLADSDDKLKRMVDELGGKLGVEQEDMHGIADAVDGRFVNARDARDRARLGEMEANRRVLARPARPGAPAAAAEPDAGPRMRRQAGWAEGRADEKARSEFAGRGLLQEMQDRAQMSSQLAFREYAREYVHAHVAGNAGERSDFSDLVYWNAMLVTDEQGKAEVKFHVSDSLTTWRVAVEGHTHDGRLATGEGSFVSQLPFSLQPKLPVELTDGDRLDLPLAVYNTTDNDLPVTLNLTLGEGLTLQAGSNAAAQLTIGADGTARQVWPVIVRATKPGTASVTLAGQAGSLTDKLTHSFAVVPRGYPVQLSQSGVVKGDANTSGGGGFSTIEIVLPDNVDPSTLRAELKLYPSPVATLLAGLDGMLRQPGGCFEQTSSSNYPNVMILQYLELNGIADPGLRARAKSFLDTGYQRLTGYECPQGGFEWWGQDPGHTALSGYGVLQFVDMSRVYTIDDGIVPRTVRWLMANRDERGYFTQNRRALHTWLGKDQEKLNTAYICWAISEAGDSLGETIDWGKTIDVLTADARASEDPYFNALVARTLFNLGRTSESKEIALMLAKMQQADGHLTGETMSITCSRGLNLDIETTALAALAYMQHGSEYLANASKAVQWLLGQRQGAGRFGATQGTVLALKALVEFANASRTSVNACTISLAAEGDGAAPLATRQIAAGEKGVILLADFASKLKPGINRLRLAVSAECELPWTIGVDYETSSPPSDPKCAVKVATALNRNQAQEGETVEVTVTVTNTTDAGVPMTTAIIGLPGGVEARVDQLRDLKKAGAFDFFEIRNREVILYWTGLDPKAEKVVRFEALASIPGQFTAPASCAYLYYEDDRKHWIEPLKLGITRASND